MNRLLQSLVNYGNAQSISNVKIKIRFKQIKLKDYVVKFPNKTTNNSFKMPTS